MDVVNFRPFFVVHDRVEQLGRTPPHRIVFQALLWLPLLATLRGHVICENAHSFRVVA